LNKFHLIQSLYKKCLLTKKHNLYSWEFQWTFGKSDHKKLQRFCVQGIVAPFKSQLCNRPIRYCNFWWLIHRYRYFLLPFLFKKLYMYMVAKSLNFILSWGKVVWSVKNWTFWCCWFEKSFVLLDLPQVLLIF
jgi:hypothetical protein